MLCRMILDPFLGGGRYGDLPISGGPPLNPHNKAGKPMGFVEYLSGCFNPKCAKSRHFATVRDYEMALSLFMQAIVEKIAINFR